MLISYFNNKVKSFCTLLVGKNTAAWFLCVSSLSPGCGGCYASTWEWGLIWDWSKEQRLAFCHSWQQRFGFWIVPVMQTVFPCFFCSSPLFPSSLVGVLKVWEASTARCVYTQTLASTVSEEEEKDDDPRGLTYLLHLPASSRLATVTAEHNILLYQLPALTTQQQVGTEVKRVWYI